MSQDQHLRTSRQRYRGFVEDYRLGRLDEKTEALERGPAPHGAGGDGAPAPPARGLRGRKYLREYLRWLRPHRGPLAVVAALALVRAGFEMVEPLFMRYIVDRVLLVEGLTRAARLERLHTAGAVFLGAIILSNLIGVTKDYRQRLLNTRVMLSLRRALFRR